MLHKTGEVTRACTPRKETSQASPPPPPNPRLHSPRPCSQEGVLKDAQLLQPPHPVQGERPRPLGTPLSPHPEEEPLVEAVGARVPPPAAGADRRGQARKAPLPLEVEPVKVKASAEQERKPLWPQRARAKQPPLCQHPQLELAQAEGELGRNHRRGRLGGLRPAGRNAGGGGEGQRRRHRPRRHPRRRVGPRAGRGSPIGGHIGDRPAGKPVASHPASNAIAGRQAADDAIATGNAIASRRTGGHAIVDRHNRVSDQRRQVTLGRRGPAGAAGALARLPQRRGRGAALGSLRRRQPLEAQLPRRPLQVNFPLLVDRVAGFGGADQLCDAHRAVGNAGSDAEHLLP
ncbi:hypothetical protein BU14_0579s0003 [Porphyra umbilicalis]|uniref:Uncharacterized protein n=1 Tax=Porphyra umbilicalis TaxID=2786 RepID=A0A1X6NRI6_PORUM|nr:hypothetical protein BU14_0579s0003 [Porphyra umbilicalis]|eukprot:OSX71195.1 hypothetical protein BU14_0579s0003 [Porphyra umbilicalis]